MDTRRAPDRRRLVVASILLGVGVGGFFDGIVFHQILQWHHVLSAPVPPDTVEALELNSFGDGLFHAATWIVTVASVFVLMASNGAHRGDDGRRTLIGGMILGWGAFNTVEGSVDHHILGIHHVRPGPDEFLYDVAFLAWGSSCSRWAHGSSDRGKAGPRELPSRRTQTIAMTGPEDPRLGDGSSDAVELVSRSWEPEMSGGCEEPHVIVGTARCGSVAILPP